MKKMEKENRNKIAGGHKKRRAMDCSSSGN